MARPRNKIEYSQKGYPYIAAKLHKGKRWYIQYHIYDARQGEMVLKRLYSILVSVKLNAKPGM